MTIVEVVVDEGQGVNDVLAKRAVEVEEEVIEVDMEAEGGGRVMEPEAEEGGVVVTTWMVEEACCCSVVVIALERSERDAWRESKVEESTGASWTSACLPMSLRRRLLTNCVFREVMFMLDSAAIAKETAEVVAVDGEAGGDEVEAAVAALAAVAAAAATAH
ncbi:hypothetical protein CBR_g25974 [Chara braunii]|uniref:Uncharacterized protein n=1 Tax=Chara braunii TaxID=69332 RepID=A0A388L6W4_CHABU|nr:hypothetical protein CBR_g25974 [Chara braunii]|eukprot:GBG78039.1 hypothetical protein CBR_g25974 [Chara braunii]